jgi:hypothetical protein
LRVLPSCGECGRQLVGKCFLISGWHVRLVFLAFWRMVWLILIRSLLRPPRLRLRPRPRLPLLPLPLRLLPPLPKLCPTGRLTPWMGGQWPEGTNHSSASMRCNVIQREMQSSQNKREISILAIHEFEPILTIWLTSSFRLRLVMPSIMLSAAALPHILMPKSCLAR